MPASFTAAKSIDLPVPPAKVWEALVTPEIISQYMFGAKVTGDWRVGGTVTYSGEWDGTPFEDRGTVVAIDPPYLLKVNYWSAMSGLPNQAENRQLITYTLEQQGTGTRLTVTQSNNPTREAADAAEGNWGMTLETLKGILS
jgi:uncharacterized protein YndB with AHSA1/START domain